MRIDITYSIMIIIIYCHNFADGMKSKRGAAAMTAAYVSGQQGVQSCASIY